MVNDYKNQSLSVDVNNSNENELRDSVKTYNKAYDLSRKHYLKFAGAAVGTIALVWWCVLYPELCFPRDTYETIYDTQDNGVLENDNKVLETEDRSIRSEPELSSSYPEILKADDEKIVISSKLLEWIKQKTD